MLFVRLQPVEFLFRGIEVLPAHYADPVVFGLAMATLPALFAFGHGRKKFGKNLAVPAENEH